ncbi:serine/threonine-protein kinase [Nocardioides iriomotensis]|uniref:non-specific serine/threonine protein kinase n=1 Tax=Nocardioides iriomotensis TaxID=715784 RepID=A0A4Q5ISR3_9ACTN|nr:serine/threonine-protein kinase [Nocardioides iriomotensis]RYU08824.1 serine/threonine protein kinase [Nocardioides iriomotensis]
MIANRYTLEREVGRGGMGAVWLAEDEVLGRPVALKRVGHLPGGAGSDTARAEREAQMAARLYHPHIVAVYDFVEEDDGERWLVMEYVDGETLSSYVRRRGRLTPEQAAPLLRQCADALAAAHAAGIVHRDVKPSNVMVDRRGEVKLTDFGIAKLGADPSITQTGLLSGSPAYLAPEVAAGHGATAASDVWSLGATAFHLLSGRPPYDIGENVLGGLYRIVNEEPPRLDDAGVLAPMLAATMTKEPSHRWSMAQVRDFLADPQAAPVVLAPTPADDRNAGGPAAGRRGLVAALVAAALVVVAALVAFTVWPSGDDEPPAAAPEPSPSPTQASTEPSPSESPSPSPSAAPTAPTAEGIDQFIRGYVAAVSSDPSRSWTMLTPKFQRESGGWENYRAFWSGKTNGQVLEVQPDPENLTVTYYVKFDNFGDGSSPTVLDLAYENGTYLIDGEHSPGFEPAD